MSLRVLLLNSPRFNMMKITRDWFVDLGEISSFPPIGLMYLASYIKKYSNHQITLADSVAEKMSYPDIEALFKRANPNVLGITAFTHTFFDILETIKLAKKMNPQIITVLGGSHIGMFAEETLSHNEVDYAIEGDGEVAFLKLLNSLDNREDISKTPGLIYRSMGKIVKNRPQPIMDLDNLPFPALDLIDTSKYYSTIGKQKKVGTICTSRGCPFRCTYCQVLDKTYRFRTPENIVDEMELYRERGIDDFFFFDDTFNITDKRVILISEEILRRKTKVTWAFRGRVDRISEEMLKIVKKAGCYFILFGIEDFTNDNLKRINKEITIEQGFRAIRLAKKYGIQTSTNWIIGFPHHKSKKDIFNLIKTAKKMNSDYAQFSILQLMPYCKMYDDCVKDGGLNKNTWSDFVRNPTAEFHVELYEKHLSRNELSDLYKMCYKKYYIRFFYILKNSLRIKSFIELKTKLLAFFAIFFQGKRNK